MADGIVTLQIGGIRYEGWTDVAVRLSMECLAGDFSLSVTTRGEPDDEPLPIIEGDACTVAIDGEVVITGYVDDVAPGYDGQQHSISVQGRDRAGDLVDCSVVEKPRSWAGVKLERIAQDIAKPFGITVRASVDTGKPFASFAIQEGETAYEAIERLTRMRGVLAVSDGKGDIDIVRTGSERVRESLVQGINIKGADGQRSMRDRHSHYLVKGQQAGTDEAYGEAAAQPTDAASDPGVTRYRPLLVLAEDQADIASCKQRALWEAAVRSGRAFRADITYRGWRHAGGLWRPNHLVNVISPFLGVAAELVIAEVNFTLDNEGTLTTITVTRPDAFRPEPLKEAKSGASAGDGSFQFVGSELVKAADKAKRGTK